MYTRDDETRVWGVGERIHAMGVLGSSPLLFRNYPPPLVTDSGLRQSLAAEHTRLAIHECPHVHEALVTAVDVLLPVHIVILLTASLFRFVVIISFSLPPPPLPLPPLPPPPSFRRWIGQP